VAFQMGIEVESYRDPASVGVNVVVA
jgi:hypothetical protein